jgi:DNA-directed RNA polymerase specialized sigma24 family protein
MGISDTDLEHQCAAIVERLFTVYDWQLLDRQGLITLTRRAALDEESADPWYLAFGCYNSLLYEACTGRQGRERWARAYEELYHMLRHRAQAVYPADVWEDALQSALELICLRLERCREPRAFFQFAWGYVQNAARSLRPQRRRKQPVHEVSLDRSVGQERWSLADTLVGELPLLDGRIAAVEQLHPRAHRQFAAVKLKFLDGMDDSTIGRLLGVSVKSVHELRAHGLRKLRADPALHEALYDGEE